MRAMHFQNRGENLLGVKFAWCEIMRSQRPAFMGFPCPAAEGNWSEPHLYIRGHTPRHAKAFASKKERRTFSVAVFVRYNTPTLVLEVKGGREASVPGTKQEGMGGCYSACPHSRQFHHHDPGTLYSWSGACWWQSVQH